MIGRPPRSPPFPYPTLSRSAPGAARAACTRSRSAPSSARIATAIRSPPIVDDEVVVSGEGVVAALEPDAALDQLAAAAGEQVRSEEHTSELQSLAYLVCRLL